MTAYEDAVKNHLWLEETLKMGVIGTDLTNTVWHNRLHMTNGFGVFILIDSVEFDNVHARAIYGDTVGRRTFSFDAFVELVESGAIKQWSQMEKPVGGEPSVSQSVPDEFQALVDRFTKGHTITADQLSAVFEAEEPETDDPNEPEDAGLVEHSAYDAYLLTKIGRTINRRLSGAVSQITTYDSDGDLEFREVQPAIALDMLIDLNKAEDELDEARQRVFDLKQWIEKKYGAHIEESVTEEYSVQEGIGETYNVTVKNGEIHPASVVQDINFYGDNNTYNITVYRMDSSDLEESDD